MVLFILWFAWNRAIPLATAIATAIRRDHFLVWVLLRGCDALIRAGHSEEVETLSLPLSRPKAVVKILAKNAGIAFSRSIISILSPGADRNFEIVVKIDEDLCSRSIQRNRLSFSTCPSVTSKQYAWLAKCPQCFELINSSEETWWHNFLAFVSSSSFAVSRWGKNEFIKFCQRTDRRQREHFRFVTKVY